MKPTYPRVPLTTRITIRDQQGNVVEEKEVATYAGLLAQAHAEGLRYIRTRLVQSPTKDDPMAIVLAAVRTNRGRFTALGDATPTNVSARVAPHFLRAAETRAKSRALRDALDLALPALEELGGSDEELVEEPTAPPSSPTGNGQAHAANDNGRGQRGGHFGPPPSNAPMSDAQKRLLFRIAGEQGSAPEHAKAWLENELGIPDLRALSRAAASAAIDRLRGGHGNGTRNGAPS